MRSLLLFFLMGLSVFSLQAQDAFQHKKVRVGIQVSPFYSYRTLKGPSNFNLMIDEFNDLDRARIGYSLGFSFIVNVKKRIAVETGVNFSDRGFVRSNTLDTLGGNTLEAYKFKYHFHYIGVPLKVNLYLVNRKVRLFVSGGLNSSIFISQGQRAHLEFFDETSSKGRAKVQLGDPYLLLSTIVGVGLDFHIVKRLNLRFEPIFRYAIYNSKKVPVDYLPYDIGFNAGLYLGFK